MFNIFTSGNFFFPQSLCLNIWILQKRLDKIHEGGDRTKKSGVYVLFNSLGEVSFAQKWEHIILVNDKLEKKIIKRKIFCVMSLLELKCSWTWKICDYLSSLIWFPPELYVTKLNILIKLCADYGTDLSCWFLSLSNSRMWQMKLLFGSFALVPCKIIKTFFLLLNMHVF